MLRLISGIGFVALITALAQGAPPPQVSNLSAGEAVSAGEAPRAGEAQTSDPDTLRVRKFYIENCRTCHGATGKPNPEHPSKPRNFADAEFQKRLRGGDPGEHAKMRGTIENGTPDHRMPSFKPKLSAQKVTPDQLLDLIRSFPAN
jgi:mono/diheme cytochrome c family protein